MNKKIKNVIRFGFLIVVLICILVFVFLTVFMTQKTEQSVVDISEIYMSEMNVQLQQKFKSITALRLTQVEGMIQRSPSDSLKYGTEMLDELKLNAEVRNFSYLGLYSETGLAEKILGEELDVNEYDKVVGSLKENGTAIALGTDRAGGKYLLLGKTVGYPLEDGTKSFALIAGVSMEYLNEALYLNEDDTMAYSHVITSDGSFVIRNGDAYRESYFERLRDIVGDVNEKEGEQYVNGLKEAISKGEEYSAVVSVEGESRHIFCSPISENVDWYLVTTMTSGVLDEKIASLDRTRMIMMFSSAIIIFIVMMILFVLYYRLSQQQMRELEEARREASRANLAKSEFLSSMSHDIRTPMNAIVGMTEIALKNKNDMERVEDCLRKVKLSSKHLLGLINDVLDMSKIESGKLNLNVTQISLKDTMDDIVNIMQPQVRARNQFFDIFIEKIQWEDVYCDSVRLNQILLNLLSNAVKFTPEQGRVDVYLYQEESPRGEDYVRNHFKVKDNGIGMTEEFQRKIWDSFSREETKQVQNIMGTGLGMAITKHIVDLMDGTIELKSEVGKGSEFHVTLDLRCAKVKEEDMMLPAWNMLVVDDNEQLCLSAVANLEEMGVHTDWTMDGEEAVRMIEERHARQEDYQFVLIDWKMPGMDGIETIREIRKRVGKEIPVFIISAYDWNDIEDEDIVSEIEGFISKPLFKSTLYQRLVQYVEGNKTDLEQQEGHEIDFTGKKILLAEDIEMNYEVANEILTSVGFEIEWAMNGKECVKKFEESEQGFYDVILMDIRMPVMNGYEATKAIRDLDRADKNLPIIAMTADAFSDDIQRCLECGMNAHTAKPLNIKELLRLLEKFLYRDTE